MRLLLLIRVEPDTPFSPDKLPFSVTPLSEMHGISDSGVSDRNEPFLSGVRVDTSEGSGI